MEEESLMTQQQCPIGNARKSHSPLYNPFPLPVASHYSPLTHTHRHIFKGRSSTRACPPPLTTMPRTPVLIRYLPCCINFTPVASRDTLTSECMCVCTCMWLKRSVIATAKKKRRPQKPQPAARSAVARSHSSHSAHPVCLRVHNVSAPAAPCALTLRLVF